MHALSVATTALLAVGALAAPMPSKSLMKRAPFSVKVPARNTVARSPANEMVRTYGKYGWEIIISNPENPWAGIFGSEPAASSTSPAAAATSSASSGSGDSAATSSGTSTTAGDSSASSSTGSETGEVTASPEPNQSEYLEPVTIGGQQLTLDFDTGSSDLWVFSNSLPSSESSGHTTFDPSKSSTWSDYQGGSWQIGYGDGSSASGTVGYDTVNIGGATVTKQAVELATSVSGSFVSDTSSDGLVGLGFSSINTVQPQQQQTFFANIMSSLEQPVFTANLEDSATGTYTFGEIDQSQYSGDIHFTTVDNSQGFWQFDSNTYSIGGSSSQCSTCSPAIADTGTSLILVDDDVAQAYYSQVQGAQISQSQGGWVYPCSATLPSFGVAIGSSGFTATLGGDLITYAQLGGGNCFGGIQSNNGQGLQIMGDMLLKNFFAVFDGGNTSFGLAAKSS